MNQYIVMEFGGDDVDTLALMFDKLQYIFRGYDQYIQAFTEMQGLYKQGKIAERDYYYGMTDAVLKYSALEFLGLKAMFEIKKALNRMNNASSTPPPTLGATSGTSQSGPQNSVASFISAKTLPGRNELMNTMSESVKKCTSCGKIVANVARFCTTCGNKM
ncbi:MAG: zinc ribbon domain-containing protein [Nitrosotalea sp.]